MYDNVYQEYINNMIGTTPKKQYDFGYDTYRNSNYLPSQNSTNAELERFYPDLYKLLYPMVQTACMRNTKPITEQTIDEIVKDIYSNFHADDTIVLNINLTNDVRSNSKTNESQKVSPSKSASNTQTETRNTENNEEINLKPSNYLLNDLIRILVIRELMGKPGNIFPIRPGRPLFRTRDLSFDMQNNDIYEHMNIYSYDNQNTIF